LAISSWSSFWLAGWIPPATEGSPARLSAICSITFASKSARLSYPLVS
jgi:hypothetical protein